MGIGSRRAHLPRLIWKMLYNRGVSSPPSPGPDAATPDTLTTWRPVHGERRFPLWLAICFLLPLAAVARVTVLDALAQRLNIEANRLQMAAAFDAALATRWRAVALAPGDAQLQLDLANQARMLWNFRDTPDLKALADHSYQEAEALSPSWPTPHYEHARMYSFKERYIESLAVLAPALSLDPNNAGFRLEEARTLEALHRAGDALQAYRSCWAIDAVQECGEAVQRLAGGLGGTP